MTRGEQAFRTITGILFAIGFIVAFLTILAAVVLMATNLARACEPATLCDYHNEMATFVEYDYGADQKCYCIYEHPVPGGKHRIQIEGC